MLLAIDTSTTNIGLALYDGVVVPAEYVRTGGRHHTQELAPAVANLLSGCGLGMQEVSAVGVAIGPGSFTSLRVGLAFVKGLALARRLPVIGVPTLDVVTAMVPFESDRRLAAVLQAGRGRLALAWYNPAVTGWQVEGPASGTTAKELRTTARQGVIVCGELTAADREALRYRNPNVTLSSPAQCVRRPAVLAEIAWKRWQAGQVDPIGSLAPIYLHVAGAPPG
jgi:tRNA threonylcarbamoyladenosine biosynthesis protein TsaB